MADQNMTRVLVTGAAGFLGLEVLRELKARGFLLRAVVQRPEDAARLSALKVLAQDDELEVCDLNRRFAVPSLVSGCARIVHAAGNRSTDPDDRQRIYTDNLSAAANVLTAAHDARVQRMVLVGHVFGLGAPPGPPSGPVTPADEQVRWDLNALRVDLVQALRLTHLEALRFQGLGLPLVLAIPTFCIGRNLAGTTDDFWLEPLRQDRLPAPAGGANFVDVRDAACGVVACLERGEPGQTYLLGGDNLSFARVQALARGAEPGRQPHSDAPPDPEALHGAPGSRRVHPRESGAKAPLRTLARSLRSTVLRPGVYRLWGQVRALAGRSDGWNPALSELLGRSWYYDDRLARAKLGHSSRPIEQSFAEMNTGHQPKILL